MILLPRAVHIYIATHPVSMRKSFDGLCNEVRDVFGSDPLSGHIFAFLNRRRNQVKLLTWTRGGFLILHKRLERGTFGFAQQVTQGAGSAQIDVDELSFLLEGISATRHRGSPRWEPSSHQMIAASKKREMT